MQCVCREESVRWVDGGRGVRREREPEWVVWRRGRGRRGEEEEEDGDEDEEKKWKSGGRRVSVLG